MVKQVIAYCGLVCSDCGAYIATQQNSDQKRKEVAEDWTKRYNHPLKPEDINCAGCTVVKGVHVGQCAVCEVRICGVAKGVKNCAYCADYGCEKLDKYFKMAPVMKTNLDAIRKGLKK